MALLLFYIADEQQVFWCLVSMMHQRDWRNIYTARFPKLISMTDLIEYKLQTEMPEVLDHLLENSLEVQATFTPHFMTIFIYLTPLEVATRLFEVFLIDGDFALARILLNMIELKQVQILRKHDRELQSYLLTDMIVECVNQFSIASLLD